MFQCELCGIGDRSSLVILIGHPYIAILFVLVIFHMARKLLPW